VQLLEKVTHARDTVTLCDTLPFKMLVCIFQNILLLKII